MNLTYPADITADTNGQWLVTFPDVPEAITSGESFEEAWKNAADALETALEFYTEADKDLPKASAVKHGQVLVQPPALSTMKLTVYQEMRDQNVRKADLARLLGWHAPQVDRLLDLHHESKMDQVDAALHALDRRVVVLVLKRSTSTRFDATRWTAQDKGARQGFRIVDVHTTINGKRPTLNAKASKAKGVKLGKRKPGSEVPPPVAHAGRATSPRQRKPTVQ